MSELDKEFQQAIEQINSKLQEAANALKTANSLAEKVGFKYGIINSQWARERDHIDLNEADFEDEDAYNEAVDLAYEVIEEKYSCIDVSDLESAMEEAGWSTSSSYC